MAYISQEKAIEMIRQIVEQEGSQTKAAARLDISAAYLSDILSNNLPISDAVASKLGYRRVVLYEPVDKDKR